MPKDVIVVVDIDAKPAGTESLDILLVSTEGAKDVATYRDLEVIKTDFTGKKVADMAAALFDQGKTTLADTLIRKVKIVGLEAPSGSDEPEKAAALVSAIEEFRQTDDDWYIILTDQSGDEYVKALAAWAEATEPTEAELGAGEEDHRKLYFGQTNNKELAITNRRAAIIYTDKPTEYADAAYLGNVGPFYPRSVTWKFKRPQGLAVPDLTQAERDALEEANVNFLTVEYKHEYVKNGVCTDGEFIDVQMGATTSPRPCVKTCMQSSWRTPRLATPTRASPWSEPVSIRPSTRLWTTRSSRWTRKATRASTPSLSRSALLLPTNRPATARCRTSPGRRSSKALSTT